MNRRFLNGAVGAILSVLAVGAAAAGDYSQLAGSARIGAAEASGMSLDEIAARKFSREGRDNAQAARDGLAAASPVHSSRTGRAVSLDGYHLALINKGSSGENRQIVPERQPVRANSAARGQLVASAGLDPDAASGMTLDAIAGHKFNRDADGDDQAPVGE